MKIFHVYDHDSMASSMGADYLAESYARRSDAEAEVERRNVARKNYWIKNAHNGRDRLHETWNWKHARLVEGILHE